MSNADTNVAALLERFARSDLQAKLTVSVPMKSGDLDLDITVDTLQWHHSKGVEGSVGLRVTDVFLVHSVVSSFESSGARPDFFPWVHALKEHGLTATVEASDGRGYQIHVEGPDETYLLIGCPVDLPQFGEVPRGFHVEHFASDGDHIDVVYHSFPDPEGEEEGDATPAALVEGISSYFEAKKAL